MFRQIVKELRRHAPYTLLGALTEIVIMIIFCRLPFRVSYNIFYVLHPVHIILSALTTSAMWKLHTDRYNLWVMLLIGYIGTICIASLSDSIIPYLGEVLLNLPNRGVHIGFIEKWWLVNPMALLGVAIAYFWPKTEFPHFGHVLISTWASLFHIIMAMGEMVSFGFYIIIFLFLFFAVWIPCCSSDIVFPLLFVKERKYV